jgi:ATP-dependent DNA helicase RecG
MNLGEFLKELELTEGRATGIPTMLESLNKNGSPSPHFYSDDDRTFFEVELFIHPFPVFDIPDNQPIKNTIQHHVTLFSRQCPA